VLWYFRSPPAISSPGIKREISIILKHQFSSIEWDRSNMAPLVAVSETTSRKRKRQHGQHNAVGTGPTANVKIPTGNQISLSVPTTTTDTEKKERKKSRTEKSVTGSVPLDTEDIILQERSKRTTNHLEMHRQYSKVLLSNEATALWENTKTLASRLMEWKAIE